LRLWFYLADVFCRDGMDAIADSAIVMSQNGRKCAQIAHETLQLEMPAFPIIPDERTYAPSEPLD